MLKRLGRKWGTLSAATVAITAFPLVLFLISELRKDIAAPKASSESIGESKYVSANLELYQDAWSTLGHMGIKVLACEDFCAEPRLWFEELTGSEVKKDIPIRQKKNDVLLDVSNLDELMSDSEYRGIQISGNEFVLKSWSEF